jgi:hypothetical protein
MSGKITKKNGITSRSRNIKNHEGPVNRESNQESITDN